MIVTGRHAGREICKALGIAADGVRRVEITADVDGLAIVRVDRLLYDKELELLVSGLQEYRCEPLGPKVDA